jgi:hypothetical protein
MDLPIKAKYFEIITGEAPTAWRLSRIKEVFTGYG